MAATLVQSTVKNVSGASSPQTLAYGSNLTAGNFAAAAVAVGTFGGDPDVTSVGDGTNTLTEVPATGLEWSSTDAEISIWYKRNISGGASTMSFAFDETTDITMIVSEFSGVATTGTTDASNTATGTSQAPSVSVTTVATNTLMLGAFSHFDSDRTLTEGTGYTIIQEHEGGTSSMPLHMEYQSFTSAGAKTVNGTIGTGSVAWAIVGVSFDEAAAATGRPNYLNLMGVY